MQNPGLYLSLFICLLMFSCSNGHAPGGSTSKEKFPFECKGVIQKSGMTIYMYGTHTISSDGKNFALQSTTIDLDRYINKKVLVKGNRMEGYPIDNGPELIDVKVVEPE